MFRQQGADFYYFEIEVLAVEIIAVTIPGLDFKLIYGFIFSSHYRN